MAEPMEITITLDADVVERLPLRRTTPRSAQEYRMLASGEVDSFPLSIEELLNDAIRRYPTLEEAAEKNYRQMIYSGAKLGDPEYQELWKEINGWE
jgi:hypothetical protein